MWLRQHHGSRWALPLARLSALCQALFIRPRASLQRFCTDRSDTTLWGRSTCGQQENLRFWDVCTFEFIATNIHWWNKCIFIEFPCVFWPEICPSMWFLRPAAIDFSHHSCWSIRPTAGETGSYRLQTPNNQINHVTMCTKVVWP